MTRYEIRDTTDNDFLAICGKVPKADSIRAWTVLCDGELACIGSLAKTNGLCILNSDFNPAIKHTAITVFRISCYIVEEALKYEKDIIAYGDVKPSKYLLKLGFRYINAQENLGVYRL
jgi:hypothetical protein